MNRLGFLKRLGALAVAAVVAKPIIDALYEADTITCGKGLIWQINNYQYHTYENLTPEILHKLLQSIKIEDTDHIGMVQHMTYSEYAKYYVSNYTKGIEVRTENKFINDKNQLS
jgi:hypothetical protein